MPAIEAMALYCRTVEEDNPNWWNVLTEHLDDAEKREVLETAAKCAEGDNSRPREFSDERGERRFLDVDAIPEASIVRPGYGRGRELIVYSDARVVHSAPDAIHRESLWRFM